MRQLLILVFLVGVGYLLYTQGLPKYRALREGGLAADPEARLSRHCVNQAEAANELFVSELRQVAQPPVDPQLWSTVFIRVNVRLSTADNACSCPTTACTTASTALFELRDLVNEFDRMARGSGPGLVDAAARQERIEGLLASARASL